MSELLDNGNRLMAAAMGYARRGWRVLPLHTPNELGCSCGNSGCQHVGKHPRTTHGVKDAASDQATIHRWWTTWPESNIGIATGSKSGFIVLDADPRHDGLESLRRLQEQHGALPPGPTVLSGGDGYHHYLLTPGFRVRNSVGIADGIDVRGDGGYIVAPPSRHASGKTYQFADGLDPALVSLPPLPDWLKTLIAAPTRKDGHGNEKHAHIREGSRNSHLTSLAGSMRRRGMSDGAILAALKRENAERCEPPLPDMEVSGIAVSVARYPAGPVVIAEVGLVKRLADQIMLTECFAQDPGGKLYRFSSGVYKPDGSTHVKRFVKKLLEIWNLTAKWSSARSEEVVEFIRVDAPTLWERPPLHLLNVRNGLLHLETGQLKPHSADHLSSVQLPVIFDPAATCPVWDGFVEDVFPDDARDFAWQIAAWLMIPDTSEQKAILLLGGGSNGKSTFLAGLSAFLGLPNVSAVSLQRLESDRFSVARLVGKLANICADLPSSHLAGTSVFKALVGGDRLQAEYKYRDPFEFVPFARLVFSANYPPRSTDASDAFFRRWLVVAFTRTFAGGEEIRDMAARLASPSELSGLLNRTLRARKDMQESGGLIESRPMSAAGEEFRKVTDPLAVWLDNWTVQKSDVLVPKDDLLTAYNAKAEAAGRPPMTATAFGLALGRLRPNLEEAQRTVAGKLRWVWLGLGLLSPAD